MTICIAKITRGQVRLHPGRFGGRVANHQIEEISSFLDQKRLAQRWEISHRLWSERPIEEALQNNHTAITISEEPKQSTRCKKRRAACFRGCLECPISNRQVRQGFPFSRRMVVYPKEILDPFL